MRDRHDRIVGGFVVLHDITDLRELGGDLRQTVRELQFRTHLTDTVFDAMSDGVIATDGHRNPLIYNRGMEALLGPPIPGLRIEELSEAYGLYREDGITLLPGEELPLVRALRGESSENVRIFVRNRHRPEGAYMSVSGRPLVDGTGTVTGSVITCRDVTDVERAEFRLRESNEALQRQSRLMDTIFNTISDGVIVADEEERYLMRNPSAERMTGAYVLGTTFEQVPETYGLFLPDGTTPFPPDDLPLTRAVRGGESTDDVEMLVRNRDRLADRYVSVSGRPLLDEEGASMGGAIVIRDVTEQKHLEFSLRETIDALEYQSGLMNIVFQNIDAGLVVADEAGKYLMHNLAMEQITHLSGSDWDPEEQARLHELYRSDGRTVIAPDDHPLARALRGEPTDDMEMVARTKGRPEGVVVSVTARPLRDENGAMRGGVAIYHDLTGIKEAEDRLKQVADEHRTQSQTLASVFDSIGDGVTVTNIEGRIVLFNPAAERILGAGMVKNNPRRWRGGYGMFFADGETRIPIDELPQIRALRGEQVNNMEVFVRNPKVPQGRYVNVTASPVRDATGAVEGSVIAFRDVTDRQRAEEALSEAFAEGRLEILDTLLHNVGNAINSVAIGVGTVQERLRTNRIEYRLSALAGALEAHRDDWTTYLTADPQGTKAIPFILALARDFREHDTQLRQTVDRVEERVGHIVDIVRTQRAAGPRSAVRKDVSLRSAIDDAVRDPAGIHRKAWDRGPDRLCAGARRHPDRGEQVSPDAGQPRQERGRGHRRPRENERIGWTRTEWTGCGSPHSHRVLRRGRLPRRGRERQRHRARSGPVQDHLRSRLYLQGERERVGAAFLGELRHRVRRQDPAAERRRREGDHDARPVAALLGPAGRRASGCAATGVRPAGARGRVGRRSAAGKVVTA